MFGNKKDEIATIDTVGNDLKCIIYNPKPGLQEPLLSRIGRFLKKFIEKIRGK